MARKFMLTFFLGVSQLGPLVQRPVNTLAGKGLDPQQATALENLARVNDTTASRLLDLDMAPFVGDERGIRELKDQVKNWLVTNQIRVDPGVSGAIQTVMARRRENNVTSD